MSLRHMFEQAAELHALYTLLLWIIDTLLHSVIWIALEQSLVPPKMIAITRTLYSGPVQPPGKLTRHAPVMSKVVHKGQLSDPIELKCGVRQGCPLSPHLFIVTLNRVLARSFERPRGLPLGPFSTIEGLEFADELALFFSVRGAAPEKDRHTSSRVKCGGP